MNKIVLNAQPLTKQGFAPYGDVIESEGAEQFSINSGTVERFHDLAKIDVDYADGGRPIVSLVSINTAKTIPIQIRVVERHPRASQAFIPMFDAPVYIVVAVPSDNPQPENLKAFVTNGRQGFNYNAGVWHMPLMSDRQGGRFIVLDRGGPNDNCDEFFLDDNVVELR